MELKKRLGLPIVPPRKIPALRRSFETPVKTWNLHGKFRSGEQLESSRVAFADPRFCRHMILRQNCSLPQWAPRPGTFRRDETAGYHLYGTCTQKDAFHQLIFRTGTKIGPPEQGPDPSPVIVSLRMLVPKDRHPLPGPSKAPGQRVQSATRGGL